MIFDKFFKTTLSAEQLWTWKDASVAECLEDSPTFGKVHGSWVFLVGRETFALCSLGCLNYILAKKYSKNKGFAVIDYLGHIGLSRMHSVYLPPRWVIMQPIQSTVEKTDRIVKARYAYITFFAGK